VGVETAAFDGEAVTGEGDAAIEGVGDCCVQPTAKTTTATKKNNLMPFIGNHRNYGKQTQFLKDGAASV
jgi:hypothetical protein